MTFLRSASYASADTINILLQFSFFLFNKCSLPGHCEIVELLLSRGIGIVFDSLYGTPLHTAAAHGQCSTMKILLDHHADVIFSSFYLFLS